MLHFDSICAHDVPDPRTTKPHVLPLYLTSSFDFESIDQGIDIFERREQGHVYGRYGNPTVEAVAAKIAQLECFGTEIRATGLLCSSGMAAIHTLALSLLQSGDKVLTQGDLYGGTTELFSRVMSRCGIETVARNLTDLSVVKEAMAQEKYQLLYFETPSNPTCRCIDIEAICAIARRHDVPVVVDNTFATPYLQRPLASGADFVIHSTTKYLNGHGNSIAGAIVGRDKAFMEQTVWQTLKLAGTNASPMEAWLVHQGMKTLSLRMDRHCRNAQQIAEFLDDHRSVTRVNYTGLLSHPDHALASRQMTGHGGMLSFELSGGLEAGVAAMRKIRFCTLAPTLGDVDTLILHPASMSHLNIPKAIREANGITDGLIRVSVGIEHVEDIIADLEQAIS